MLSWRPFFFPPLLFGPQKSQSLGLFYWAVSRHGTKRTGHFYPGGSGIAGELAKSKPELLKEGLGGGWARGVGLGLGQELAPERIITFNIGKMGAVLVEEAGSKGFQGSMGQLGRPSVDEGCCHRVLEEAGCLSGFRVCEELDKTGGFFAPSSSKDDEATSSAAHEFGVCTLLSASGFGQGGSCILPGSAPWLAISGEGRNYGGVNC